MGYLTPNEDPASDTCRVLFVPNNEEFLAIVRGALQELTLSYNFTKHGALSPDETANRFVNMFDKFCFNEGVCRVIGEIIAFAGSVSPDERWLVCDGSSILRLDYPDLFTVIGTTYGAADSDHFSLPDLQGRAISGVGTGAGLSSVTLGEQYGEEVHQLTVAEMPSHDHTTGNSVLLGTSVPPPFDALGPNPFPALTGLTGGDGSHNTVGPRLGVNYLIVAAE